MAAKDTQRAGVYDITGFGDFAISNRVSYEYDLNGPRSVKIMSVAQYQFSDIFVIV